MSSVASNNKKSPASEGKRRPLRSTEMETTDSSGKKFIVTETFYDDGSSIKEEKIVENDKVISEKITETAPKVKVTQRKTAPATKTLPVDELLTSKSEVRRITENNQCLNSIDEEHNIKSDQQDKKMRSTDAANSNFAPNSDLEQGSAAGSDKWNDNSAQISADSLENRVHPPNEHEIVEAFVVPNENLQDPVPHQPKKRKPLKSLTSKFRSEDGKLNKKFWLLLFIIVLLIAIIGISVGVGVTPSKSSPKSSEKITEAPTKIPTLSPSLKPTVITKCTDLCLEVLSDESKCPSASERRALRPCNKIDIGELCDADGECETRTDVNNCDDSDVYRRVTCKIDEPWAVDLSENGYEYYVELEEMDWLSHVRKAALNDAYLASIHSHEERTFVINQMRRNGITKAFIGGIRKGAEDDPMNKTGRDERFWRWSDETEWDYISWNSDEPNYKQTNSLVESVVELDHRMSDVPPVLKKAGVYKRRTSRKPNAHTYNLPQSLGYRHTCVTNNKMELFCMGYNYYYQLGVGALTSSHTNVPTFVKDLGTNKKVKSVGLGYLHSCAILDDNSLECWGYNYYGQVGVGTNGNNHKTPRYVNSIGRTVTQVSLGLYHTCALINTNSAKCWGYNFYGQLGSGSNQFFEDTPQGVNISPERTVKQISCGGYHTCAVLDNGDLTCWGRNNYGQLGGGTNETNTTTPVNVILDKKVKMVSLGRDSTCVILEDNSLKCWGRNYFGQLGVNSPEDQLPPTDVDIGSNYTIKHISSSGSSIHRCAIRNDNRLLCWGYNWSGQLGRGNTDNAKEPVEIYLNEKLVKQVSVGYFHTCAVLFDESLKCWGSNYQGNLGYNDETQFKDASKVISLKF